MRTSILLKEELPRLGIFHLLVPLQLMKLLLQMYQLCCLKLLMNI